MRIIKILAIILTLLPLAADMQGKTTKRRATGTSATQTAKTDKYPAFDSKEAARYWHMWITRQTFTQEEFSRVIDLCNIAYDYLNADITTMLENNVSSAARRRCVTQLDQGKTSEMSNFVRSFANNLQNLAAAGQFDDNNVIKVNQMIEKKAEFRRLVDLLYHS